MATLQELFGGGFDTNSVEPQGDYPIVPPGNYPVSIDKAEVKVTKKGDGHYLEITLTILDGPCVKRKLWDRINIQNPSQQCTEIGLRSLAALGQSLGITKLSATEQLLNGVCIAHVKVKDEQNEIRTYSATSQPADKAVTPTWKEVPVPAMTAAGPFTVQQEVYQIPQQYNKPQQAQAAASGKPPWAR
jgi:hypothetical protein